MKALYFVKKYMSDMAGYPAKFHLSCNINLSCLPKKHLPNFVPARLLRRGDCMPPLHVLLPLPCSDTLLLFMQLSAAVAVGQPQQGGPSTSGNRSGGEPSNSSSHVSRAGSGHACGGGGPRGRARGGATV